MDGWMGGERVNVNTAYSRLVHSAFMCQRHERWVWDTGYTAVQVGVCGFWIAHHSASHRSASRVVDTDTTSRVISQLHHLSSPPSDTLTRRRSRTGGICVCSSTIHATIVVIILGPDHGAGVRPPADSGSHRIASRVSRSVGFNNVAFILS